MGGGVQWGIPIPHTNLCKKNFEKAVVSALGGGGGWRSLKGRLMFSCRFKLADVLFHTRRLLWIYKNTLLLWSLLVTRTADRYMSASRWEHCAKWGREREASAAGAAEREPLMHDPFHSTCVEFSVGGHFTALLIARALLKYRSISTLTGVKRIFIFIILLNSQTRFNNMSFNSFWRS